MELKVGVRQGKPVSPLLLNLVLNQALKQVKALGTGYRLNGELISALFC